MHLPLDAPMWRVPDQEATTAFPYRGGSMYPTFRQGDILVSAPAALDAIRPGDVVLFSHTADGGAPVVAHRVRARTGNRLITQGDCSPAPDPASVLAKHLLGRVMLVWRDGKARHVWNGRAGLLWLRYLHLRRRVTSLLRRPYQLLRASGIVHHLWHPTVTQIRLATGDGTLVKYIHGRRTVAHWWPEERRLWCRKPYDLVLDLPTTPDS